MRKKVIAANWKLYKTPKETRDFFLAFLPHVQGHTRDEIVVCPPFVDIFAAVVAVQASDIAIGIGAQDLYWRSEGAFTGEVSAPMLRGAGCTHVIIGHSERRQHFGETDDSVNAKLKSALLAGLVPIVCVGEVIEEREAGLTEEVLRRQCTRAFAEIAAEDARPITVAYEPVWAIGTGRTATPELAAEAHRVIRSEAAKAFGQTAAAQLRILYGGSVKPENAAALMAEEEIDGALVGGASLDPKSFAAIVKYQG
ncbi:MAG: triose-phosphate isomerase [Acidobacteria bacterium]|nr:triose-phosphate isomerase [Acidobacteriota bacterium]